MLNKLLLLLISVLTMSFSAFSAYEVTNNQQGKITVEFTKKNNSKTAQKDILKTVDEATNNNSDPVEIRIECDRFEKLNGPTFKTLLYGIFDELAVIKNSKRIYVTISDGAPGEFKDRIRELQLIPESDEEEAMTAGMDHLDLSASDSSSEGEEDVRWEESTRYENYHTAVIGLFQASISHPHPGNDYAKKNNCMDKWTVTIKYNQPFGGALYRSIDNNTYYGSLGKAKSAAKRWVEKN